jgi:hypothetical protein
MAVYVDSLNYFSIGTTSGSATSTSYTFPSNSSTLIATRVSVGNVAPAISESSTILARFSGNNWNLGSAEFIVNPGYSKKGTTNGTASSNQDEWTYWNLPISQLAGNSIDVSGELVDNVAAGLLMGVDFLISSEPISNGQPINRATSSSTSTATESGPTVTLAGCQKLVELTGVYCPAAIAVDNFAGGILEVNSSSFQSQQTCSTLISCHSTEGDGQAVSNLSKVSVDVTTTPGKTNSVSLTSRLTQGSNTLSNNGVWIWGVGYNPTSLGV